MADRMQFQAPSIFTNVSPRVNVDDGTSKMLEAQASVFINNGNEAHKRQIHADMDLAQKEGQRMGYEMGAKFRPVDSGALFYRQYNQTGLQMAGEKVSIDTQKTVKRLLEQNPANPQALAKQLNGWREGFEVDLPEEMQPVFGLNFERIADGAIAKAEVARKELASQQAAADFFLYEREVTNTMEQIAPLTFQGGVEGDAARAAVATLRQNYMESLAGNGPQGSYTVGGYEVKSARGRSGAFSPLEIAKKMTAFDNMVITSGVMGNFQKQVEAGNGVEGYMQFAKGDMEISTVGKDGKMQSVKISDILTNDEMADVAGKMRSFIGGINSIEEGEQKKYERNRDRHNEAFINSAYGVALQVQTDKDGTQRIIGGDPVELQKAIAIAIEDPLIKSDTIDKLQKLAKEIGTGQIDNPITTGAMWTGISTGEISDYQSIPSEGISDETRVKMYNAIDKRNAGQHWTNSRRYQVASDYADAVLAPEKSAGFTMFGDPNSQSAADRAEWNKRMIEDTLAAEAAGTLPQNINAMPAQGQFDFVGRGREIADEIAARRKGGQDTPELADVNAKIAETETQINNPKKGDDVDAIKARYRELQNEKARIQSRQQMGIYQ